MTPLDPPVLTLPTAPPPRALAACSGWKILQNPCRIPALVLQIARPRSHAHTQRAPDVPRTRPTYPADRPCALAGGGGGSAAPALPFHGEIAPRSQEIAEIKVLAN